MPWEITGPVGVGAAEEVDVVVNNVEGGVTCETATDEVVGNVEVVSVRSVVDSDAVDDVATSSSAAEKAELVAVTAERSVDKGVDEVVVASAVVLEALVEEMVELLAERVDDGVSGRAVSAVTMPLEVVELDSANKVVLADGASVVVALPAESVRGGSVVAAPSGEYK